MKINSKYLILPYLKDFRIPGFIKHYEGNSLTLSASNEDLEEQYHKFCNRILQARGKYFLPVMRMSDGEYQFLFGEQPPSSRNLTLIRYLGKYLMYIYRKSIKSRSFSASTLPGISSGNYTQEERKDAILKYEKFTKIIAKEGILALHLTFSSKPFQEKYHPRLIKWLDKQNIDLSESNYVPFYFVYALLRGTYKTELFQNQSILVIHGATGYKQKKIKQLLLNFGAKEVLWHSISGSRSLYDTLDISKYQNLVDFTIVGAGVGKPNILAQLKDLKVPCIDAGFVFEVWANDENKWLRAGIVSDDEWDNSKIRFK